MSAKSLQEQAEVKCLLQVIAAQLGCRIGEPSADGGNGGAAAADDMMANFLAMRAAMSKHWKQKRKGPPPASGTNVEAQQQQRVLRVMDPLADNGPPSEVPDVLVCRLTSTDKAVFASAKSTLLRAVRAGSCGYHLVFASYGAVKADAELRELLLDAAGTLFVVPANPSMEGEFLHVGGSALAAGILRKDGGVLAQCERAIIGRAQADKAEGRAFCRLAREATRLAELVDGGTAASRMAHLFSRTPVALRARLQLDAEAHFSVTDEAMADTITEAVGRLAGVGGHTLVIDATACVGGNTLSFAKAFRNVAAIENDPTRHAMLTANVAATGRQAVATCVLGDCVSEVPRLAAKAAEAHAKARAKARTKESNGDGGGGGEGGFVVFLDPPWGGLAYKDRASCELRLSGVALPDLVRRFLALDGCLWAACKVPFNFDAASLTSHDGSAPRVLSLSKTVKCLLLRGINAGGKQKKGKRRKGDDEDEVAGVAAGDVWDVGAEIAAANAANASVSAGDDGGGASMSARAEAEAREASSSIGSHHSTSRELNKELARLARCKQLSACRAAFTAGMDAGSTDAWSHAILINAHATCGDGEGALAALDAMRAAGERPCVMSYTAALKAPCGNGQLDVARRLLHEMERDFAAVAKRGGNARMVDFTPNNRTANTFFRGCLVAGGIAEARALLSRLGDAKTVWASVRPDVPSLEYVGTLCAQALLFDEATKLTQRLLEEAEAAGSRVGEGRGGKGGDKGGGGKGGGGKGGGGKGGGGKGGGKGGGVDDVGEDGTGVGGADRRLARAAAARVRVAICRGAALAGAWARCGRELKEAKALLDDDEEEEEAGDGYGGGGHGRGGGGSDGHGRFRAHQRAEARAELRELEAIASAPPPRHSTMPLLLRRTLSLHRASAPAAAGGTETGLDGEEGSLGWVSGLVGYGSVGEWRARLNRKRAGRGDEEVRVLGARLHRTLGGRPGAPHGPLNLDALFATEEEGEDDDKEVGQGREATARAKDQRKHRNEGGYSSEGGSGGYRLELGCGTGEWLAAQAAADPSARWLGLELMMRRAYATGARLALGKCANAASLHGDATEALERWIPPGGLDAIYVNHPEPPQQSASSSAAAAAAGGMGTAARVKAEAAHMLNDRLLSAAAAALRPGRGTLTIVTDSPFYADMLLDSIATHGSYEPIASRELSDDKGGTKRLVRAAAGGFELLSARPGPWCGHAADASSYFDRLWQTGLSVHSAAHERFVLHVRVKASREARPHLQQDAEDPSKKRKRAEPDPVASTAADSGRRRRKKKKKQKEEHAQE